MSLKEFIDEMLSINKLQYLNNIDELMHNIVVHMEKTMIMKIKIKKRPVDLLIHWF